MRYWIDPKIKWQVFKKINAPFQGTIVPNHADKMLWEMLRDRKINMFFDTSPLNADDPLIITTKDIPRKTKIITNPK